MTKSDPTKNSCTVRPFPRLAIVGASARAAAWSVYFSGRSAAAADMFADADLKRLCSVTKIPDDSADLVDWLQHTECDAWFYTGALENQPALVDRLAEVRPLMGNDGETLRRVRDPLMLQEALRRLGMPFPETRNAEDGPADDGRWLAKSYRGSSGMGVSWNKDAGQGFIQRFVEGQCGSALFAGNTLLGISRQLVGETWTGAGEFQYCGSLAPWSLPERARQQIKAVGSGLHSEFNLQGLFGVDFIYDGESMWPVEVNPRYPASAEVLELASPIQVIDWHLSTCKASGLAPLPSPDIFDSATVLGKAIWFASKRILVSEASSTWALSQRDLADVPVGGTEIGIGEPVLTVRAEAWTTDELLAVLRQRIEEVATRFTTLPPLQGRARGG